ncbi:MAG TPA: serine hydrolase domain-containing protein [Acidimicrobiales bacterium]|nr:serine hydrolase domain-containing protein [Acidimicrobiales bacterium]
MFGTCADGFEPVRDAFEANFVDPGELGAAVCVVVDGRVVVDLWSGLADAHTERPWAEDTPALVYSATKGPTATCALQLWEQGVLDLDAPVAEVWPEFAAAGKGSVTTRHLLTHQAGLPVFDEPITFSECNDHDLAAARLAAQAPRWEPGTAHGYHPLTWGWLVGEVVRRVSGRSVGAMVADLGLDLWVGLPPEREAGVARLAAGKFDLSALGPDDPGLTFVAAIMDVESLTFRAFANPPGQLDVESFNAPELHQAEWPAANGIATARALATFYGELAVDRILSAATLDEATRVQVAGPDKVLAVETSFGLGFSLHSVMTAHAGDGFGHEGAGGSVAFADRTKGLGFAYVMNQLTASLGADRRSRRLVEAVYSSL